jgi:hypothetical protein
MPAYTIDGTTAVRMNETKDTYSAPSSAGFAQAVASGGTARHS